MAVDTQKLLALAPAKKGGNLASAIKPKESSKETAGGKLVVIKTKIVKASDILKGTLAAEKKNINDQRKIEEQKKRKSEEKDLETPENKDTKESKKLGIKLPKMSWLDSVKNFIFTTLFGFVAVRFLEFLPALIKLLKPLASIAGFIMKIGEFALKALIAFVDIGYKAYDATRGFIKNLFGEEGAQTFDNISGHLNKLFNLISAIALGVLSIGNESNRQKQNEINRRTKGKPKLKERYERRQNYKKQKLKNNKLKTNKLKTNKLKTNKLKTNKLKTNKLSNKSNLKNKLAKSNKLNTKLTKLNSKLTKINTQLKTSLSNLKTSLGNLKSKLKDNVSKATNNLKNQLTKANKLNSNLTKANTQLKTNLSKLKTGASNLKTGASNLKTTGGKIVKRLGMKMNTGMVQNMKGLSKMAKGVRIPIVGPLISALFSYLSDGKWDKALFVGIGTALGEMLGTAIPIPVLGTILGGLVGFYIGDLLFTLFRGGGVKEVINKLKEDLVKAFNVGKTVAKWGKTGFERLVEGIPTINVPFVGEQPNLAWLLNPANVVAKAKLLAKAFLSRDPMKEEKDKKVKEKKKTNIKKDEEGYLSMLSSGEKGKIEQALYELRINSLKTGESHSDMVGNPKYAGDVDLIMKHGIQKVEINNGRVTLQGNASSIVPLDVNSVKVDNISTSASYEDGSNNEVVVEDVTGSGDDDSEVISTVVSGGSDESGSLSESSALQYKKAG